MFGTWFLCEDWNPNLNFMWVPCQIWVHPLAYFWIQAGFKSGLDLCEFQFYYRYWAHLPFLPIFSLSSKSFSLSLLLSAITEPLHYGGGNPEILNWWEPFTVSIINVNVMVVFITVVGTWRSWTGGNRSLSPSSTSTLWSLEPNKTKAMQKTKATQNPNSPTWTHSKEILASN